MIRILSVLILFSLFFQDTNILLAQDENDYVGEQPEEISEREETYEQQTEPSDAGRRRFDPTNVPFRSLRNRRNRDSVRSIDEARKGFDSSKVQINPDPTVNDEVKIDENPAALKTATGKDANEKNIVVAGPEYNKEQAENVPADLKPTLVENFDFHDAELDDVVESISKLTKKNFILGQKLRGKITIISPSSISIEDAWRAFLTALQINDYSTVQSGAYIKIVRRNEARYTNIKTYDGNYNPDNEDIITRFINLTYIDAEEIATTLRELISRAGGRIFAYPRTNTLIITDAGSNINRLINIIKKMDVAGFEEKLDIIKVHYASASEIAEKIAVITDQSQDARGGSPVRTRRTTFQRNDAASKSPAEFSGKIIPDDRTNSLIVLATDSNLKKLRKLLEKIDYATRTSASSNIHIHYLKNASAEEIAGTLTGITGDKSGKGVGSSRDYIPGRTRTGGASVLASGAFADTLFSGNIKVNADKPTNSLVIVASQQDYESLKDIIAKLDVRRNQVFVEAIIAEINIVKGKKLGVSASSMDEKTGIFSFGDTSLNSLLLKSNPMALFGTGLVGGLSKGEEKTTIDGKEVSVGKFNLVLKALYGNSDTNVLSTPQILTTDNEEAEIIVGEKIPFIGETTNTSTGTTQQVQRQDVGVKLKISPQINRTSEYVKLKIEQEASDVVERTIQGMPNNVGPATLQRSTKTTVIVKDQEMVSIGGLIRDKISESESKVPILGDIPILGWLFRNKSSSIEKTNLILFIKPTIISEYSDLRNIYHERAEDRRKFVTKVYGEEDIHQKFIDERDKVKIENTVKKNEGE